MKPLNAAFDSGMSPAAATPLPGSRLELAMLAHDMRNALQGVFGGLGALEAGDPPAEARAQIQRIASAARTIEALSDVLAGSGEAAESARATDGCTELGGFLDAFESRWAPEARARGLGFELMAERNLPAALATDGLALARVLGNLVGNSIDHSDRGTVSVAVRRAPEGGIVFRLTDEGSGLNAAALAAVSGPRGRVTGLASSGHGLGLRIVQELSAEIGARIAIGNRDAGGVEALLELPAALCIETAVLSSGRAGEKRRGLLAGLKILLAEDNPTNQMVATQMLSMLDAEVTLSADGIEALERFEETAFDLVVVDIEMPRMTGLDVIRAIRSRRDGRQDTPIVALTAYALREHRDRIAGAGANGLISKPIASIEALAKGLAEHVRRGPQAVPAAAGEAAMADGEPVVDLAIYDALAEAIGAEMMSELLEKVVADLGSARDDLAGSLAPVERGPIRSASHILISVAGAIGANRLQRCARKLNTAAHAEDLTGIADLVRICMSEIDAAVIYAEARRTET